jgi:hypothetical protein
MSKEIRCAIYTRKSTEEGLEQKFNSLDAQRLSGESYVMSHQHEGWVTVEKKYDDGGYSGGNLNRPALQELFKDIKAEKIDCVVVYKNYVPLICLVSGQEGFLYSSNNSYLSSIIQRSNSSISCTRFCDDTLAYYATFFIILLKNQLTINSFLLVE